MAQTVPIDAYLGANRTGLAIGATLYQLDGSTSHAAFSTSGWYEAPAGSGAWHHAGLSLSDAGGVVAVGVSGTEYMRVAVPERQLLYSEYTACDNTTIGTINTKIGTPVSSVSADIAGVQSGTNDLQTQIGTAGAGLTAVASAANLATLTAYVDTEVASILAAVDTEIAAIKSKTDNLPASPAATGDIPGTAAIATAIFAVAVETGHDLTTVLRAIYALTRGRFTADDPEDPTTIIYFAPDNATVRVTHTVTATERTVA